MAYRDSCAHLLIPLNRCRGETYFLPWKCEVRIASDTSRDKGFGRLTLRAAGRETQLRKVPIRRIQEARGQDERAQGSQGRCSEQLRRPDGRGGAGEQLAVYICGELTRKDGDPQWQIHCVEHFDTLIFTIFLLRRLSSLQLCRACARAPTLVVKSEYRWILSRSCQVKGHLRESSEQDLRSRLNAARGRASRIPGHPVGRPAAAEKPNSKAACKFTSNRLNCMLSAS
jgi:hypothetical protein